MQRSSGNERSVLEPTPRRIQVNGDLENVRVFRTHFVQGPRDAEYVVGVVPARTAAHARLRSDCVGARGTEPVLVRGIGDIDETGSDEGAVARSIERSLVTGVPAAL